MSPPPARALLCMTSFDTRSFLKCRCVPLRDLSLVWKKFNGEWCNPLVMHKNFHSQILLKYRTVKRLQDEVYRYYETQIKSEKPVMLPRHSMRENFRCKIFLESEKGSHTIFYGTTGQKTLDRKSWYPLIMHEFYSIPQNFWNTEVFSVVFFYYCETKIFDKNVIPSPSYPWEFSIWIFFWNTDMFPN